MISGISLVAIKTENYEMDGFEIVSNHPKKGALKQQ